MNPLSFSAMSKRDLGTITLAATLALAPTAYASLHPTGLLFGGSEQFLANAPQIFLGTLPTAVDHSAQFPAPGNQGALGSCVAWAVGYGMFSQQVGSKLQWGGTNTTGHLFSPTWIYNQIHVGNSPDGGGAYFGDAFNLLVNKGGATLAQVPYNGAPFAYNDALPSTAASDALHYKSGQWTLLPPNNVTQLKAYISSGKPVVIGINVYPDFDNLSPANPIFDNDSGFTRGGHAIVLIGYDDAKKAFKLLNSWGTDWGLGGYGWISYTMVQYSMAYVMTDPPILGSQVLNTNYSVNGGGGLDLKSAGDRVLPFSIDGSGKKGLIMYRPGTSMVYLQKSLGEAGYQTALSSNSGFASYGVIGVNDLVIPLDFNGDGNGDLILAGRGTGKTWVLQGRGDGTFKTIKADFAGLAGFDLKSTSDQILVTDYDGDGKADLVLYRPGTGRITVAHSKGDGTFSSVVASTSGINGFNLLSANDRILSLDMNGDKKKDLVFYRPGQGAISVLKSNGNGTFASVYSSANSGMGGFDLRNSSDQVLVGDVNGDKFDDLVFYRPGSGLFAVLKSNGNGAFSNTMTSCEGFGGIDLRNSIDRVLVGDFNGDGRSDIFLYRPGSGKLAIARGTSAGNFVNHWSSTTGIGRYDFRSTVDQVLVVDQDGNGMSEVISYRPGSGMFQTAWFAY